MRERGDEFNGSHNGVRNTDGMDQGAGLKPFIGLTAAGLLPNGERAGKKQGEYYGAVRVDSDDRAGVLLFSFFSFLLL